MTPTAACGQEDNTADVVATTPNHAGEKAHKEVTAERKLSEAPPKAVTDPAEPAADDDEAGTPSPDEMGRPESLEPLERDEHRWSAAGRAPRSRNDRVSDCACSRDHAYGDPADDRGGTGHSPLNGDREEGRSGSRCDITLELMSSVWTTSLPVSDNGGHVTVVAVNATSAASAAAGCLAGGSTLTTTSAAAEIANSAANADPSGDGTTALSPTANATPVDSAPDALPSIVSTTIESASVYDNPQTNGNLDSCVPTEELAAEIEPTIITNAMGDGKYRVLGSRAQNEERMPLTTPLAGSSRSRPTGSPSPSLATQSGTTTCAHREHSGSEPLDSQGLSRQTQQLNGGGDGHAFGIGSTDGPRQMAASTDPAGCCAVQRPSKLINMNGLPCYGTVAGMTGNALVASSDSHFTKAGGCGSDQDSNGGRASGTSATTEVAATPAPAPTLRVLDNSGDVSLSVDSVPMQSEHCHGGACGVGGATVAGTNAIAKRKLIIASVLCLLFMIAECIGGVIANSLAIATDAAHLLTDFASFMISLFAIWLTQRPASQRMSYGWHRAEVIGALTSVLMIWVVTGVLFFLAVQRVISDDYEIDSFVMLVTAGVGVLVNIVMAVSLHYGGLPHGHSHGPSTGGGNARHDTETGRTTTKEAGHNHAHAHGAAAAAISGTNTIDANSNINVRAALIHVVGDFLQSIGVFTAALIIHHYPQYRVVDPICTFVFSVLVLITTLTILRETILVLMEGKPKSIDFAEVRDLLMRISGVRQVHDLRIWALTLEKVVLSTHVGLEPGQTDYQRVQRECVQKLRERYAFYEVTVQVEEWNADMADCKQCNNISN